MDKKNHTRSKVIDTNSEKIEEFQKLGRLRLSAYNRKISLKVKEDHPLIPLPRCFEREGMDLSGGSMTDSTGRMIWRLSNYLCKGETVPPVDFPVSFIATPLIEKPMYVTVKYIEVETSPNDLVLEVYSWDNRGEPAPFMPYYWRCRIPIAILT